MCSHKSWGHYGYFYGFWSGITLSPHHRPPSSSPPRLWSLPQDPAAVEVEPRRPQHLDLRRVDGKHNFSKEKRCHMMPWHDAMTCHDMPWLFESFWPMECLTTLLSVLEHTGLHHLSTLGPPPHCQKDFTLSCTEGSKGQVLFLLLVLHTWRHVRKNPFIKLTGSTKAGQRKQSESIPFSSRQHIHLHVWSKSPWFFALVDVDHDPGMALACHAAAALHREGNVRPPDYWAIPRRCQACKVPRFPHENSKEM